MATTSSAASATTTESVAFNSVTDHVAAKAIWIRCDTGSSAALLVRIPNMHGADKYAKLAAGESREFVAAGGGAIGEVNVKGDGGTATYSHYVTAV